MSSYDKLSKDFYIKMYSEYLAYEIYLDNKFHIEEHNTIIQILNACFDEWVLTDNEMKRIIRNGKKIFKEKYNIKS